jgi:RimJ/RimL family protein N-acetyltransferase
MAGLNLAHEQTSEESRRIAFVVERLKDADRIRAILKPRVEYTAYALGQLEPAMFRQAHWYLAKGETGQGFVVHSAGGLGEATLTMGDAAAVQAILSLHPGPAHTYATSQPEHLDVLGRFYHVAHQQPMVRMAVGREDFQPARGETRRLIGKDIRTINRLYSSEGGLSFYSGDQIDAGIYYGVFEDEKLVSVAGTHVVSPQEGVAVVGNVFTHPRYRGRGYAERATSATTKHLLHRCPNVVLTVDPKNTPATRAYQRLGYREVCFLIEAAADRRDFVMVSSAFRALWARLRGRRYGGELVYVDTEI